VLAALALRSTEYYTARFQTLPVVDWVEARPPLVESARVPSASELARGLLHAAPMLVIRDDARPLVPVFQPPADTQRTMGGVRDAARIELGVPGVDPSADHQPVRVVMELIVFHRIYRAAGWVELIGRELDVRSPHTGEPQVRVEGPDARDGVWVDAPASAGGVATVAGSRGPVAFELWVTSTRTGALRPEERLDLTARSESIARQMAADWGMWLEERLAGSSAA
jgi:hypothetical protein